jgi:predicted hotdog family 3-hydroxylacyl-ACP dehydratase
VLNAGVKDHEWIERHIPHQGRMCLLDGVEAWDEKRVCCRASSHRSLDNPLRAQGRLGAACGIEYAAQAMAVHGALTAPRDGRARVGFLVSVRGARLLAARLDDIVGDLEVVAESAMRSGGNVLYEFRVSARGAILLEGRAAVVLDAEGLLA